MAACYSMRTRGHEWEPGSEGALTERTGVLGNLTSGWGKAGTHGNQPKVDPPRRQQGGRAAVLGRGPVGSVPLRAFARTPG